MKTDKHEWRSLKLRIIEAIMNFCDNLSVFKVSMMKYNSFIGGKLFHAIIKDFMNNKYPH